MKSFVYCITNCVNGKRYVGKTNDLVGRWRDHLKIARNPDKDGLVIHQAMRKHGVENFVFEIVAECSSEEEAFETERHLIREWNTMTHGYNLNEGGKGGYRPSLETRARLSAAQKGRAKSQAMREKLAASRTGKTLSLETREKIGASQRGRKLQSEETRQRLADALRRRYERGEQGFKGRKHSENTKQKMRDAWVRRKALGV